MPIMSQLAQLSANPALDDAVDGYPGQAELLVVVIFSSLDVSNDFFRPTQVDRLCSICVVDTGDQASLYSTGITPTPFASILASL